MAWVTLALLVGAASLGTAVLVPAIHWMAFAGGAIDVPGERRLSKVPTARLGGLAIVLGTAFVVAVAQVAGLSLRLPGTSALVAGALLVAALGVVDDFRSLRPRVKLVVEIAAALVVVEGGGCRIDAVSLLGSVVDLGPLAVPFTVGWIVLVTNAFNLIDGIDGLATGTAVIALVAVTVVARRFGLPEVAGCAAVLAGACIGFLVFNFHPACIYLGDSGSLFLGFSLGVLSTLARAKGATGAITMATLLVLALPIGDTLFAIERRYVRGLRPGNLRSHVAGLRRIFQPDLAHLHHRVLGLGLGHRGTACALWGLQAIACAWAIYLLVGS